MIDQLLNDAKQAQDMAVLIYKDKEGKICFKGYVDPVNSVNEKMVEGLINAIYNYVVTE